MVHRKGTRDVAAAGHSAGAVREAFGAAGPDVVVCADRHAWLPYGRVVEVSHSYVRPEFFRFTASTGTAPQV